MRTKDDIKEFVPLAFLLLVGIASIIEAIVMKYTFDNQGYVGLTTVLICLILFTLNRRWYRYVMAITLIIGTIGLTNFSTWFYSLGIGPFQFNLISLVGLIIFTIVYRKQIMKFVHEQTGTSKTPEQIREEFQASKDSFKRTFEPLSDHEIERRLGTKLVPTAIAALRELRDERNETTHHNTSYVK